MSDKAVVISGIPLFITAYRRTVDRNIELRVKILHYHNKMVSRDMETYGLVLN